MESNDFEYRVFRYCCDPGGFLTSAEGLEDGKFAAELNRLGCDGRELVSCIPDEKARGSVVICITIRVKPQRFR